jgi:DNA repair protein RadD
MKLRPYQERAISDLRASYGRGKRAPCLVLPTGGGKTVIASAVIRGSIQRGRRVLFLAHRAELISQSVAKLEASGVTDVRIIQAATDLGSPTAPVAVASIPTLTKWGDRMPAADLVVFDECHHTVAKTWASIADRYSNSLLLGMTATPQRADGKPLGDVFDDLVIGSTVAELTELGHLVPCRMWAPPVGALESRQLALSPVAAYQQHGNGERAVIFCVTVEHAEAVAAEMNAAGIPTGIVHGSLASDERRQTLTRLRTGDLRAVVNVHVLTEGWDEPAVSVCIMTRKPQHVGTFLQMVGRVLRPAPGKTSAILLDLAGSSLEHGSPEMDREYSLDGKGISKADRQAIRQCTACGGVFLAGPQACPACGAVLPARPVKQPKVTGVGLVEASGRVVDQLLLNLRAVAKRTRRDGQWVDRAHAAITRRAA